MKDILYFMSDNNVVLKSTIFQDNQAGNKFNCYLFEIGLFFRTFDF